MKNYRTALLAQYGNDPFYKDVILADNFADHQTAKEALINIRGAQAYKNLQASVKKAVQSNKA